MKKLLALVLALVMTLSLAVVGSNAAFKDAKDVNETYSEAVDVLSGMGVFNGYKNADGTYSFQPKGDITRAEVAAIVYRLYTADVTDKQASLYATYNKFSDMNGAAWAAGYIGYCANAGLIKGYDAKTFGPSDKVTGYQALAMILRAVGYDKNDEFTGAQWQLRVASTAQQLGILKNVKGVDLNAAASRELVAELLFRTAAEVPTVTYTAALGYSNMSALIGGTKNATLGYKNFGLTKNDATVDAWGRPCYTWTNGKTGSLKVTYATISEKPVATYTEAVTECKIAEDAGLKTTTAYTVYTNGKINPKTSYINPLNTNTKIGAQGTLVEVYEDTIVVIDTFLAKVTKVENATYDIAGHLKTEAKLYLNVYDQKTADATTGTAVVLKNGATNYEYVKGDFVLVNAYTNEATTRVLNNEKQYAEVLGKATSIEGAQSVVWFNAAQHTVDGTVYSDNSRFYLDQADKQTAKHTWLFDSYGNLIGAVDISTQYNYGVISKMWWLPDSNGSGVAKAELVYMDGNKDTVTLSLIDDDGVGIGNLGYVPVSADETAAAAMSARKPQSTTATGEIAVSISAYINETSVANAGHKFIAGHMFQFEALSDGTVAAYKVMNEISSANVTTGVSAISGNSSVNTNSGTVYLVRTGTAGNYTYTSVAGFNNIGKYTDATVDYVKLDANSVYADYVYLYGTANDNTTAFVFAQGNNYSAQLKTLGGVQYYEFTYGLQMDGSVSTLKVLPANYNDVIKPITEGVGKLFKIDYQNGYAVKAEEVGTTEKTAAPYVALYLGNDVTATKDALYDASASKAYNVTKTTVVVGGTLDDLAVAGKPVYVIYTTSNNNDVLYIYIASNTVWDVNVTKTGETAHASVAPAYGPVANGGSFEFTVVVDAGYHVAVTNATLLTATKNADGSVTATFKATGITANTNINVAVSKDAATVTVTNNSSYQVIVNGKTVTGSFTANVGDVLNLVATGNVAVTGDANVTAVMNGDTQHWTITVKGDGTLTIN